ncbi:hypothetical protein PVL29_014096 [Vitis rotundifolia]|uniref:Uncharacterized protein n=1 Tax=Vitis rotundifolia TaxID=103349 RepID=A0AA38ZFN4_VITRO|nr:hypothetical protein PVL29_014096 [Vitis rotundifolia]
MGSALIETNPSTSPNLKPLLGENYELTLNQSIRNLLDEFHKGTSDLSHFVPVFFELMQARVDPRLESIWVYTALSFRSRTSAKGEVLNRVAVVKDLFQLLSACSGSSSSSKSIALLAPVVFEVYRLLFDLSGKELSSKRDKKVVKEIGSLIEVILGYISVCSSGGSNEDNGLDGSIKCLDDLIRVWMYDGEGKEGVAAFFPLVSAEISGQFGGGECDVDSLAGVVIAEAFLLKMCMYCRVGVPRVDLEKELRSWAVASIAGFQNYYFYETVVKMLLELALPVTSLLSSEDEVVLRKILYDAVILADYSFLNPERAIKLPVERLHRLALTRLIVTHEAIEFLREHGDRVKPISYVNAFSSSHLSSQLTKWVSNQIVMEGKVNRPNGSSPKALIKWLLNLEGQGIRIFDDSISRYRAKLVLDISKVDYEQPVGRADFKKLDDDLLFYFDKREEEDGNKEDKETDDSMSAAFVSAARTMKLAEKDGERKRKKGSSIEKKKQIKFRKYKLHDNSNSERESSHFHDDGLSSGSEIENPLSDDEDMEVKEE